MTDVIRTSKESNDLALHQQTDAALWLLRYLNRLGGLGQDKHRLIDAVLEGRAKVLGDTLHIEQPSEKALEQRRGTPEEEADWAQFGDCPRCWRCAAPVITIPGCAPGCIRNCPPSPQSEGDQR